MKNKSNVLGLFKIMSLGRFKENGKDWNYLGPHGILVYDEEINLAGTKIYTIKNTESRFTRKQGGWSRNTLSGNQVYIHVSSTEFKEKTWY